VPVRSSRSTALIQSIRRVQRRFGAAGPFGDPATDTPRRHRAASHPRLPVGGGRPEGGDDRPAAVKSDAPRGSFVVRRGRGGSLPHDVRPWTATKWVSATRTPQVRHRRSAGSADPPAPPSGGKQSSDRDGRTVKENASSAAWSGSVRLLGDGWRPRVSVTLLTPDTEASGGDGIDGANRCRPGAKATPTRDRPGLSSGLARTGGPAARSWSRRGVVADRQRRRRPPPARRPRADSAVCEGWRRAKQLAGSSNDGVEQPRACPVQDTQTLLRLEAADVVVRVVAAASSTSAVFHQTGNLRPWPGQRAPIRGVEVCGLASKALLRPPRRLFDRTTTRAEPRLPVAGTSGLDQARIAKGDVGTRDHRSTLPRRDPTNRGPYKATAARAGEAVYGTVATGRLAGPGRQGHPRCAPAGRGRHPAAQVSSPGRTLAAHPAVGVPWRVQAYA